jgi:hypothetical protein
MHSHGAVMGTNSHLLEVSVRHVPANVLNPT